MKDDMTKDKRRLTICTHKIMAGEETGWNIAEFILSVSLSICTKEVQECLQSSVKHSSWFAASFQQVALGTLSKVMLGIWAKLSNTISRRLIQERLQESFPLRVQSVLKNKDGCIYMLAHVSINQ